MAKVAPIYLFTAVSYDRKIFRILVNIWKIVSLGLSDQQIKQKNIRIFLSKHFSDARKWDDSTTTFTIVIQYCNKLQCLSTSSNICG
jgi:hypothetical protein